MRFSILLLGALMASPAMAGAAQIEGVQFAERLERGGAALQLNNVGLLRYRKVIKAYVAALYLGPGVKPEQVLEDVPKRLEIEYFWAIKGPDFGKEAERILAQSFPPARLTPLRERLEKLHAAYVDVKPKDRYSLTYLPASGMELALNGKPILTVPGHDFASAYFAIWLGEKPGNPSLKAQLLKPR